MKDYQSLLSKFSNGFFSFYTHKEYIGIPNEVIKYLEKYWLNKEELDKIWKPIRNTIFKGDFWSLPDGIFPKDFETITLIGGSVLHNEEYYKRVQQCMNEAGDKYFIIVEDYDESNPPGNSPPQPGVIDWPPLHFKFPSNIGYKEVMSGEFVSEEVMWVGDRNYFFYGDSRNWGIYAEDGFNSLSFIGFKSNSPHCFIIISKYPLKMSKT
jgi:hypothetical protein